MISRDTSIYGLTLDEMEIGDKAYVQKTITEHDVYAFAGITGDFNVAHVNEEVAKNNMFGERIAHGALTAGLISAVLGMKLPGADCLYIGQTLKFIRPVKFGDTIKAEAEVIRKIPEKNRVIIKTTCTNQNKEIVLVGEAEIMPKKGRS